MSVKARKLKDGSTVYDAVLEYGKDSSGKRIREVKTFATKKEAEVAQENAKRVRNAMNGKAGFLTMADYIDRCYWPIASRRLAKTSQDTYEREIEKRIKPFLGDKRLDKISRYEIQRMIDFCGTETVGKKCLQVTKTIMNEALSDGYIPSNPALAKYAYPIQRRKRDNGVILTTFEDIGRFIVEIQNDASETITRLVMTGLLLGLRPEERYALDFEDIDFEHRTVTVKKAYVTVSGKRGSHDLKATKTELSNRVLPMPQWFVDFTYYEPCGHGAYITNANGERLSPSTGQKMWRRYLRNHPDLPPVTLENMRHSYATSCLHAGMEISDLSRLLGHSDINTTYRRYVKPNYADMQKSMVSIDTVIDRSVT